MLPTAMLNLTYGDLRKQGRTQYTPQPSQSAPVKQAWKQKYPNVALQQTAGGSKFANSNQSGHVGSYSALQQHILGQVGSYSALQQQQQKQFSGPVGAYSALQQKHMASQSNPNDRQVIFT